VSDEVRRELRPLLTGWRALVYRGRHHRRGRMRWFVDGIAIHAALYLR
jgi:hypothetical protein